MEDNVARLVGPDEGLRTVYLRNGRIQAQGRKVTLYADPELTTLADVLHIDGSPITDSTVTVDGYSRIPQFQYPPGDVDVVYGRVGTNGPVIPLYARYDSRIDQIQQTLTELEFSAPITGYAQLRNDVVTLEDSVSSLSDDVNTIESNVSAIESDVNAIEGDVSTLSTALANKQDTLPTGLANQFLRGSDKTFVNVTKSDVGLSNVDNTSDLAKPISTAVQNALDGKVNVADVVKGTSIALGPGTLAVISGSAAGNVAIGRNAQNTLTTGQGNTAIGDNTQVRLTTSNLNTAVGSSVHNNLTTGSANTGVGGQAQFGITTGSSNVAIGNRAQYAPGGFTANATTTATQQTSVGYESGQADATQSTAITTVGYRALAAGTGSVALGAQATAGATASIALGNGVVVTGAGSVAIGRDSAGAVATSSGTDDFVLGTLRHRVRAAMVNDTANVRMFRLPGDTDDTASVQRAVATGARRIYFPPGNYTVTIPQGGSLASFTGVNGVFIDAGQASITNTVTYAFQAAFTSTFLFNNCKNIRVEVGNYSGQALANPNTDLGYRGELFVRLVNNCDGAIIRGTLSHVRYGVQSGDYTDETLGNCKNMDITLRTFFCGYPIALYLAEGVRFDIDADDVHRAAYLAGCIDVAGIARWKNQYVADTVLIISDAKTGTGTSRGCQNLKVESIDKGSTVFQPSTMCAGISLSRVDPGTTFSDIDINVYTKSTNTISSTIGGFRIISGVSAVAPEYTHNWDPSIVIRNVRLSGVIDHSAQTSAGNSGGEISIRMYDHLNTPSSFGTLDGLLFEDLFIRQASGGNAASYLVAPLLSGNGATFRRVYAPDTVLMHQTNDTVVTTFESTTLKTLYQTLSIVTGSSGARTKIIDSQIDTYTNAISDTHYVDIVNSRLAGASSAIRQKYLVWNLSGGSTIVPNILPANAMVLTVQGIVTQEITGATGFQVGVTGSLTRYADVDATAVGSTFTPANGTETAPRLYLTNTNAIVTAKGGSFTGGQMRIVVHYIAFTPLAI